MAWCQGVDDIRLLIAPDPCATGDNTSHLLSLRHPKLGNKTCYLFTNGLLQELHWFKQSYGSWFLGDYVCEDGSLHTATPIDPVFIMLPLFEEARMKKGNDPGRFRQLDEIIFVTGYPGYQHLLSIAENCMQVVCEIKEIGLSKFFRLDDSKVLAWIYHKNLFLFIDSSMAGAVAEAVSILAEYLKDEPWLNLLCGHLKLNLQQATRTGLNVEASSTAMESNVGSSNLLQLTENSGNDKKITRSGKQVKKAKVETASRNIKDMFSRAAAAKWRS